MIQTQHLTPDISPGEQHEEQRVLIATLNPPDARALARVLGEADITTVVCPTLDDMQLHIERGAAAAVIAEELLAPAARHQLADLLHRQPEWSDFPMIVMVASGRLHDGGWNLLKDLNGSSNTVLLERPVRRVTLQTTVQTAIRSRNRQYQVRNELNHRRRVEAQLAAARDQLELRVAQRTSELQHRADQLSRLTSQLTLAEQRERQRIAKVLHDHLQQLLVSAKISLSMIHRDDSPDESQVLDRARECIGDAIATSRSLTVEFAPPILHDAGLAAGLRWLAQSMLDKHHLHVRLSTDPAADPQREDVRILLFESVRELLFNTVKHAHSDHAAVEMAVEDDEQLRLTVSDGGRGFEPTRVFNADYRSDAGFGLFSIRERLNLLGGSFHVQSSPDQGARFTLIAPRGE